MSRSLRIAIADDEADMRYFFEEVLQSLGHEVVVSAKTGRELLEKCLSLKPDLIITDIKMPDMDGLEAASKIAQQEPIPVILVSAHHNPELIERAEENHVLSYLVKPIKQADLEPAIALTRRRFEQFQTLYNETADLRQALADRKIIERAKGLLMKKAQLDEHDAFRRLQKLARDNNRKLVDVAQMIITAEEALRPADAK